MSATRLVRSCRDGECWKTALKAHLSVTIDTSSLPVEADAAALGLVALELRLLSIAERGDLDLFELGLGIGRRLQVPLEVGERRTDGSGVRRVDGVDLEGLGVGRLEGVGRDGSLYSDRATSQFSFPLHADRVF